MGLSKILAWLKLRFDIGGIFLTIANFILLVIVTAPKFIEYFKITTNHSELIFTIIAIPVAFLVMLGLGQILIWMRYMENYADETNKRNPIYAEILTEIRSLRKSEEHIEEEIKYEKRNN